MCSNGYNNNGELSVKAESRKHAGMVYSKNGALLVKVEKDASGGEKHKMNKRHL